MIALPTSAFTEAETREIRDKMCGQRPGGPIVLCPSLTIRGAINSSRNPDGTRMKPYWELYDLGKDQQGNSYYLNTKFAEPAPPFNTEQTSSDPRQSIRQYAHYTVQVTYNSPQSHNGVKFRNLKFYASCGVGSAFLHGTHNAKVGIQSVQDFDVNGRFVSETQVNEPLRAPSGRESSDWVAGCYGAYTFPYLVKLLETPIQSDY